MPLLNLVAANIAGWVHLIKYAYLHDDKLNMYAACPDIPSVTNFQPETQHNQSMVGPWPLAPHHDHYNIYIMYI